MGGIETILAPSAYWFLFVWFLILASRLGLYPLISVPLQKGAPSLRNGPSLAQSSLFLVQGHSSILDSRSFDRVLTAGKSLLEVWIENSTLSFSFFSFLPMA